MRARKSVHGAVSGMFDAISAKGVYEWLRRELHEWVQRVSALGFTELSGRL
jgi:hypothetical protein